MRIGSLHALVVAGAIGVATIADPRMALAQNGAHGSFEISLLGGVTVLMPGEGNSAVGVALPTGAGLSPIVPSLRITIWSRSRLTFDAGFSFIHLSEGNNNAALGIIEGGLGMLLADQEAKIRPFGTILFGVVAESGGPGNTEAYIGGLFGARTFIRDYAATRFQVGYRRTLGNRLDLGSLECVGGISFFL